MNSRPMFLTLTLPLLLAGCSSSDDGAPSETETSAGAGGASVSATGGAAASASGGATPAVGGATGSGGSASFGGGGTGGIGVGGMSTGGAGLGGMGRGGAGFGGAGLGGAGLGGEGPAGGSPSGGAGDVGGAGGNGGTNESGAGGSPGSSCVPGVDSGDACDPAVDTELCVRSTRTCVCEPGQSTWACTASGGEGGDSGLGGATGSGGSGLGGSTQASGGSTGTETGGSTGTETGGSTGTETGGSTGTETGGSSGSTFVEDEGTDCVVADLPSADALSSSDKLPDPFLSLDGQRIATRADWRCRRAEIKKQAETYIYGAKPPRPASVTGTVTNDSITVEVSENGRSTQFSVSVELPQTGSAPYPAIAGLTSGFFGFPLDTGIVKGEGVAVINYDPYVIGSESGSRANKQGAFYDIYGANSTAGLLVAWSWGISRIIDVIEDFGGEILRADAIGVSGCSRFGKGAFTIGAFDQRIALTMPIESGTGGVPIWRGIAGEGAQSASSAYGETYWLGDAFGSFTGSVGRLPIDTHEVVAMVAPRGLYIMDNPHIANLGPRSAHVGALGGAEVYAALGASDNISYISAVADGGHCGQRPEWAEPLRENIRKFLTQTGSAAGRIAAAGNATGNLADWRTWTTPTLP